MPKQSSRQRQRNRATDRHEQIASSRGQRSVGVSVGVCARNGGIIPTDDFVNLPPLFPLIGMFEHEGAPFCHVYFGCIRNLLVDDGVAVVHSIGRSCPPSVVNPWLIMHIFPGGHIPSLSEMSASAENSQFLFTDIEVLRLHYAKTLRVWYQRFQLNCNEIGREMGEKFCRMWEFYLAICEVSFQRSDLVVYQMQLARQHYVVPTTRDYLYSATIDRREPYDLELAS